MNPTIESLGNIGEFVAAVVTLVTLVYLARQIRQSNQIARWEAHRSSVLAFTETTGRIFGDADTARIWRQGLLEPESLDEIDRIRLHHALSQTLFNFKDTSRPTISASTTTRPTLPAKGTPAQSSTLRAARAGGPRTAGAS